MKLRDKFKIWFMSVIYKRYDLVEINGVYIISFWKLKKVYSGEGFVCIPLRLRRDDPRRQIELIVHEYRNALALRILSKQSKE